MKNSIIFMLAGSLCLFSCGGDSEPELNPCQTDAPVISSVMATAAACNQSTGSLVVNISGGEAPLQYSLNGGAFQPAGTFSNLAAGNYTLTVKDANGCTASADKAVSEESNMQVSGQVNAQAGCGSSHGEITLAANGGSGNYTFSIDGSNFQASPNFTNLAAGTYTLTVKDNANCSATSSLRVNTGISYDASVKSIIQNSCAISGCHVGGTGRQNFTNFATIQANAANIKTLTQNKSMPKTGSLTQAQIDAIACWVDDGALNN